MLSLGSMALSSKFLFTVVFALYAWVDVRAEIAVSASYFQYSENQQVTEQASQNFLLSSYSYNLQWLLSSRFVIGVNYLVQSSHSSLRARRETGSPNLGFFYGPFLLEAGPVSYSIDNLNRDQNIEWRDAKGFYGSLTIYDSWANWLLIGFQFTFLDIEYRKYYDGVNEQVALPRKLTAISPSLRMTVLF